MMREAAVHGFMLLSSVFQSTFIASVERSVFHAQEDRFCPG